ncbi:PLP-dependent aminotransferase family protein [Abyssisolibacter fermentans]|uniref:MocR-like pyridoxine biosynthesis transcription factor PdxR n=1 Tax=Abyssisolibacter fermentans TaxID=1766203 RepID=UPI00082D6837|nr:PLP-dependent aminotransferase family protein [Abyssisolibacter fermentans]
MDKLNIKLEKNTGKALYVQLYNQIRKMILENTLKPHSKLPPIRKLASELEVNNVTIVNAYKLLEENDFVYKKVGSGTFIKDNHMLDKEYDSSKLQNYKPIVYNFASTTPTSDLFPVEDFKVVINSVLNRDKGGAFIYQHSQGFESLRISIKKFLYKSKIFTDIDNIHIVSGAQQGIDIISKALVNYGDIVFCESPTYGGAIAAFKSRGAKIIDINLENDGLDMRTLENKLLNFKPQFIYVMPNFQNPTGISYSIQKRKQLIDLAKKYDTYIVEDDYVREINYNDNNILPIKSMDTNNRVIYIKSFSKTLMPGLRLGFTIIPLKIYSDVLTAKQTSDISTSALIQRCFDLYLRKGLWEKHIQNMNEIYSLRYNTMIKSLKKYMPKEIQYNIPYGGLGFWFALPEGFSSIKLHDLCINNDISIVSGSNFYVNKQDSNNFRLSIASISENLIEEGIAKLSKIISDFLQNPNNQYINNDTSLSFF